MDVESTVELARRLADAEPSVADAAGLVVIGRDVQSMRSFLDALDVRIGLRNRDLAAEGRSPSTAGLFGGDGRRPCREGRRIAGRAGTCAAMPGLHDALADGRIGAEHVDAATRALARLDDAGRSEFVAHADDLVPAATGTTVELFEDHCQRLARQIAADDGTDLAERQRRARTIRRRVDRHTGMCHTHLELHPEADARMWAALRSAVESAKAAAQPGVDLVRHDQLTADTVVELITGGRRVDWRVPEVCAHIDWSMLLADAVGHGICQLVDGTTLAVSTVRRLCCEANIVPVVVGGDGAVLDVGRSRRLATREQRQALAVMYSTCAHPGCTVAFDVCQIHHVTDWTAHHGATDMANLLPLCCEHHHLVHEGRWRLELWPDRTIRLTRPDGTVHHHGPSINRQRPPPRVA